MSLGIQQFKYENRFTYAYVFIKFQINKFPSKYLASLFSEQHVYGSVQN